MHISQIVYSTLLSSESHILPDVGPRQQWPHPRMGEVRNQHTGWLALTDIGLDKYSRIMVEYLTYAFMGNTRGITLTTTIKRKNSKKKKI